MKARQLDQRFWDYVDCSDGDGCWLWRGHSYRGYGYIWTGGGKSRAHRVAWELENGPIPPKALVLHRCDTTSCVRPSHLYLGSQSDNMRDMWSRDRRPRPFGVLNPRWRGNR